jgi:hypothetical protein
MEKPNDVNYKTCALLAQTTDGKEQPNIILLGATQKYLKDKPHGPHKKPEVNLGAREGQAVPASYKTPTVFCGFLPFPSSALYNIVCPFVLFILAIALWFLFDLLLRQLKI